MCGIAGFLDPSASEAEARERLSAMLAVIAHRGPDGEGAHIAPGAAAGMRRLSIIDLEGGWQPIWNEDETIGVVFNGEIYNYVELRAELESKGHVFRTHSDTEVLVHLYEELGEKMPERLRGMFGFAIVDQRQCRLFLARDHFGQKPLYYSRDGGRFAFGSELKSLLRLPWVRREEDGAAFLDFAAWLSLPAPRTHFVGVKKLPAGCSLVVPFDVSAAPAEPRRFYQWDMTAPAEIGDLDEAVAALDAALRESVRVHLRADVPIGVLLSSGLDSRAVSAYAQELQGGKIETFTVGFGTADSEAAGAAETAREIGSVHHAIDLTHADFLEDLPKIAWHLDEPVGDPACFAVRRVCLLARNHVKVLLSGEGSDELFAGYDARYRGNAATISESSRWRTLGGFFPRLDPAAPSSRWRRLLARAQHTEASEAVAMRMEGLPGDVRQPRGFTPEQLRTLRGRMDELGRVCRPQRDLVSTLLALDLDWQLAESLLQKADKMSMAASIELRTPILDREIAALAARLDTRLKLAPGGPGKAVLRHVLARKLNEPLDRPKRGFPVPLREWFTGPLRAEIEGALFSPNAALGRHLDGKLLRVAWEDFVAGKWDGARTFFTLWLYEAWQREVVKGVVAVR